VKGLCAALGIAEEDVTSPSFTLVNPYAGRLQLYHIDLYRLDEGARAAHAVDLDELLSDEQAVIVIEWAERMGNYPLPGNVWRIAIEGDGDAPRRISILESFHHKDTKTPNDLYNLCLCVFVVCSYCLFVIVRE